MAEYILVDGVRVAKDFTPETFGRLTTIEPAFRKPYGNQGRDAAYQKCRCICGNEATVQVSDLKSGHTQSCGCFQKDCTSEANKIHGKTKTKEHTVWKNLCQRCNDPNNPKYPNYGGRGIKVCSRWREPNGQGFINFLADMGECPPDKNSVERKEVNGNYEPGNCVWADVKEQARNKRNNITITYNGKTQCLAAWAEELGINYGTLHSRLRRGWPIEDVLA